jgi:hypothetical protein
MWRFAFVLVTLTMSLTAPTPVTHAVTDPASVESVRAEFLARGFEVGAAVHWTWPTPGLTTFSVRDGLADRILLVLVYPDVITADRERLRVAGDLTPVVAGYGPSTWRGNVAIVQSSEYELRRAYGGESGREMEILVRTGEAIEVHTTVSYIVDADVVAVLDAAFIRASF